MNDTPRLEGAPGPADDARFVMRPCRIDDLPAIERIAAASVVGITTLPPDLAALRIRVERAVNAFASDDAASGEETYLFVLEDRLQGAVVGTSGIAASAGFHDRFYSYRNEFIVHASESLRASNRIHTLHLCHDLTGHALFTSFYIAPPLERTAAPQLLSRARLLYISQFRSRFPDRIASESPGLCDERGHCPFWEAVGQRFFNMTYTEAELKAGGRNKAFIAELMPQAPVYVPLLPEAAQLAVGQLHPVSEIPFGILMDEGFEADTYVDIFDGGPTAEARFGLLRSVRKGRRLKVGEASDTPAPAGTPWQMVANTCSEGFRATLTPAVVCEDRLLLTPAALQALELKPGEAARCVELLLPAASEEETAP
jgi:arginine N-succinyltransferase